MRQSGGLPLYSQLHNDMLCSGPFRCKADQVALEGDVGAGSGFAALPEDPEEIPEDAEVAAAVAAGGSVHADRLLLFPEPMEDDLPGAHVRRDLSLGAEDLELAAEIGGEGSHGEGGHSAALEFQIDHLAVHHIVVAVVDTAAIGSLFQSPASAPFAQIRGDDVHGPAGAGHVQIELCRIIGTAIRMRTAVRAALRRTLRGVFRVEMAQ